MGQRDKWCREIDDDDDDDDDGDGGEEEEEEEDADDDDDDNALPLSISFPHILSRYLKICYGFGLCEPVVCV